MYLISILQTNIVNFTPRTSTFLNREGLNPFSPGRPLGSAADEYKFEVGRKYLGYTSG
jgi:hypothetical protein